MTSLMLSIAVIATFALVAGGCYLVWKGADRKRGVLMLVAALVLLGNVLIWAWPARTPAPAPQAPASRMSR